VDPTDLLGSASYLPVPAVVATPTVAETAAMRAWLIDDSKAKTIILRRLTPGVALLLPRATNTMARGPGRSFVITSFAQISAVSTFYAARSRLFA
jgi:hypothetical protein